MTTTHTIIAGSHRDPVPGARPVAPVPDQQHIEVTVTLRVDPALPPVAALAAGPFAASRTHLSRDAIAQARGASAADVARVKQCAESYGITVLRSDLAQRSMVLAGPAGAFRSLFDTPLDDYEFPEGTYRGRVGHLKVPVEIADAVQGVFGLDDRPQATPKFQVRPPIALNAAGAVAAADVAFTPTELAKRYRFPGALDGHGQCIAIIELGGGLRPGDIKNYFHGLGLPVPKVKVISVDHGKNRPSTADSADGEVMLDIEVAGAIAPKATIAVYFAPNTDRGFLDAINAAIHDKVNKPSVISISWGSAEVNWTAQAMDAFEQAFTDAALLGVTVCAAAGDNGSSDGAAGGQNVDFPSSAPHVLGCGGTKLVIGAQDALNETVWNAGADSATGGGFSTHFAVPAYQGALAQGWSGRGVPDVAGNADPATGYRVLVDGKQLVIGGTSAVAPLWAGLVALLNQSLGRPVGFIHPLLYGGLRDSGATRDITQGNNGAFSAAAGWDPCTGWGAPDGEKLQQALAKF